MVEKKYLIEGIEHSRFFGPYNSHFKIYKEKYPNLKLSSRGDKITIKGEEQAVNEFIIAVESIVKYLKLSKNVTLGDIERLVIGEENSKNGESHTDKGIIIHGQGGKIVTARTKNQQELVDKVDENDLVFAIGPAGTGKTYTAVALAVRALKNKEVKKIVLCRPAVEAGESLGFLPGDMKDKVDPYLRPLYDALGEWNDGKFDSSLRALRKKRVRIHMRICVAHHALRARLRGNHRRSTPETNTERARWHHEHRAYFRLYSG